MSVSEDTRPEGFAGASAAPAAAPPQRDGQFDKTPPQDIAAEQCVLGGMLLSKDAIADVVEILESNDFYRPATRRSSTRSSTSTAGASRRTPSPSPPRSPIPAT